jgi:tetratricopeptide (TPR) repeat protein
MEPQAERFSPWLDRQSAHLAGRAAWILPAEPAAGAPWLLDHLARCDPQALILALPTLADGGIVAGERFAHALTRMLGFAPIAAPTSLAQAALQIAEQPPFRPSLVLLHHLERAPSALHDLAPLARVGVRIGAVQYGDDSLGDAPLGDAPLGDGITVVERDALALTAAEARAIAEGFLPPDRAEALRHQVGGRIEAFVDALRPLGFTYHPALAFLPAELRPDASSLSPRERIHLYQRRGAWIDAFEIAVRDEPARAPSAFHTAGAEYPDRGLAERLLRVLAHLPPAMIDDDDLMARYALDAAGVCGDARAWRPRIERILAARSAPELRALHAVTYAPQDALASARRALEAAETPLTLRLYGFLLGSKNPEESSALLERALQRADELGEHAQVVAAASDLANMYVRRGDYHGCVAWAWRALEEFDRRGLRDRLRRLGPASLWVFGSLVVGEVESVADEVAVLREFASIDVPTGEGLISTIADHDFVLGRYEQAEAGYRILWRRAQGQLHRAGAVPELVRTLLRLGRGSEAFALANQAIALVQRESDAVRALATLALAEVLAEHPERAREAIALATEALEVFVAAEESHRIAQATILLARLHRATGDLAAATSVLQRNQPSLRHLRSSGWQLFGGAHPDVAEVEALAVAGERDLYLGFFGEPTAVLRGVPTKIGRRDAEILLVLSQQREGVSEKQLDIGLYGESDAAKGSTKSRVSRLRKIIPITPSPYRIDATFDSDLGRAFAALRKGDALTAVMSAGRELLPDSDAPRVEEIRGNFHQALEDAVLASSDPDVALAYLERIYEESDEVVEHALTIVSHDHPQVSCPTGLRARIKRDLNG